MNLIANLIIVISKKELRKTHMHTYILQTNTIYDKKL